MSLKEILDKVTVSGVSYNKMEIFGSEVSFDALRKDFTLFIRILFPETSLSSLVPTAMMPIP